MYPIVLVGYGEDSTVTVGVTPFKGVTVTSNPVVTPGCFSKKNEKN